MSNLKITDLASLSQSVLDSATDFLLVVDVSDTTMSATGTNLKITPKALVGGSINDLIQTWNSGATAFTGFKLNVTDTASDADSSLMDLQVAGSSKFRIKKDGTIYVNGSIFSGSGGSWGSITGTLSSQTDLQSALDAKLSLSGGTLTGPITGTSQTIEQRNSTNAQRFNLYGTYTDGSNYRRLYISSTTAGAFTLGVEGLGTGASGNTLTIPNDLYTSGFIELAASQRLQWASRSRIISWTDGNITLYNSGESDFFNLHFGGTTSSYPAIQRSGATLRFRLADDSNFASILANAGTFADNVSFSTALKGVRFQGGTCGFYGEYNETYWILNNTEYGRFTTNGIINSTYYGFASTARASSPDLTLVRESANTLAQRNDNNSQVFRMYRQYTDASNYSRFYVNTNASASKYEIGTQRAGTGGSFGIDFIVNGTKMIDFNAGNVDIYFSQRSVTWGSANSGEVRLKQKTAFSGRLDVVDAASDNNYSSFVLAGIWFWGTTSAHPYLKRSSTTLQARLGDDSAFGSFQGKLTTETNYTAGAPTATGYLILYDATGTAYRVPAVLN